MALNDTLTSEEAADWWHHEVQLQLRNIRRTNNLKDERDEITDE